MPRHADRDRHADRHRHRQSGQHLHGGRIGRRQATGGYGTYTMTAAGVWTYTLDNTNSAVQALNDGATLTDTFTVTTIDGTAQVVTITINGTNDAAIISGATAGSVTEAGGARTRHADSDRHADRHRRRQCAQHLHGGRVRRRATSGYGSFTMTAAGVWTYTLDNNNCVVQALNDGDTLTDTFKVTTIDGTAQVITITIHGADDAKYPPHIYARLTRTPRSRGIAATAPASRPEARWRKRPIPVLALMQAETTDNLPASTRPSQVRIAPAMKRRLPIQARRQPHRTVIMLRWRPNRTSCSPRRRHPVAPATIAASPRQTQPTTKRRRTRASRSPRTPQTRTMPSQPRLPVGG